MRSTRDSAHIDRHFGLSDHSHGAGTKVSAAVLKKDVRAFHIPNRRSTPTLHSKEVFSTDPSYGYRDRHYGLLQTCIGQNNVLGLLREDLVPRELYAISLSLSNVKLQGSSFSA